MKFLTVGLVVLIIITIASCKKESNEPSPPSTLQELHFGMYDSAYTEDRGGNISTKHFKIQRIDTFWRDTTLKKPIVIFREDTLAYNIGFNRYEGLGPRKNTPGGWFYIWFNGDTVFTRVQVFFGSADKIWYNTYGIKAQ